MARAGARVVLNDLPGAAEETAAEIKAWAPKWSSLPVTSGNGPLPT